MYWQLNRLQFPVYNLGHGRRFAIWVQGCSLGCKGCINPELWKVSGGKNISLEQLAASLLPEIKQFDGVTITGGEPFRQYEQLIAFCTFLKQKSATNILVFSGYTINQLIENHPDNLFLSCIDHLVDGPYLPSHGEKNSLRGSSNQNFFTFENGKIIRTEPFANTGKWSIHVENEEMIFMAGIPGEDEMKKLKENLMKTGIKTSF
jgi:anaerobic ribonucleoside-triphosphate reductase activating protein